MPRRRRPMTRISAAVLVVSLSCCLAAAKDKPTAGSYPKRTNSDVAKRIVELEQQWAAAQQKGDRAVLNRLLADDYKYTDLNGATGTKAELLASLQPAGGSNPSAPETASKYEVRVYGDTAVVTHNAVFRAVDKEQTVEARGIDVWVRRQANWQVVAHQWTVVSGPRGESLPREFLNKCARMSFQPEVHSLYGNAAVVLSKLENDSMALPERRGYLLLIETENSAELAYYERVTDQSSRVYHWDGTSVRDLREQLTNFILANRGIACVVHRRKPWSRLI